MDDPITRLRAQIESRLAKTKAATQGEWEAAGGVIHVGHITNEIVEWVHDDHDAEHIAANQPSQVIRDCEADLKLLDAHLGYYGPGDDEFLPIPTLTILATKYGIQPESEAS
ncbi:DUF6221 family protein [Microbispora sp. GKU 823]|uniref:DUF6221 family protein n=1 Tax=Microbispora sp. GKU 823 TaxID=1652100 RepID=UPI0009A39AC8|nr:DUF6221 family protein [Microbispora sp. GKU 823]OPG13655.1 hypothetical protein B1L11_06620 [Microbispora sp. GKU 823]